VSETPQAPHSRVFDTVVQGGAWPLRAMSQPAMWDNEAERLPRFSIRHSTGQRVRSSTHAIFW